MRAAVAALCAPALGSAAPIRTADPAAVGLDAAQLGRADAFLHQYVQPQGTDPGRNWEHGVRQLAGSILAVARDGALAHWTVDGEQVLGKVPLGNDTIFRFYSMTKPVTAVTLMTLYEEGKFALDDPLELYIPAFKDMKVLRTPSSPVSDTVSAESPLTVRHILTHTGGLSYGWEDNNVGRYYQANNISLLPTGISPTESLEDWANKVATVPLLFQPGTHWHYCNGLDVAGRLVEVLSGVSFQTAVQKRVLDPLGMDDTGFFVPAEKQHRLAPNYVPPNGTQPMVDSNDTNCVTKREAGSGGGGLCGTASDYLRFALMLVSGGEFQGARVLAPRTVRLLTGNSAPGGKSLKELGTFPGDMWSTGCVGPCPHEVAMTKWAGSANNWGGIGQGLGGQMIIDPVQAGQGTGKGMYYWGGAAGTLMTVDVEERMAMVFMMQRQDSGPVELGGRLRALLLSAIRDNRRKDGGRHAEEM